jgi:hypothetical protein
VETTVVKALCLDVRTADAGVLARLGEVLVLVVDAASKGYGRKAEEPAQKDEQNHLSLTERLSGIRQHFEDILVVNFKENRIEVGRLT